MNSSGVEFQGTYPWISRNLSKFYLLGRYLLSLQKKVVFPALKFTSYPSKIFYLTAIFKLSLVSYIQYAKQKFHVLFTALVKVYDNLPCRLYLNLHRLHPPPPLSQGLDDPPPHLKVWTHHCTRYAINQNLYKPRVRTNIDKQMISFKAIDLWASIPRYLEELNEYAQFKKKKNHTSSSDRAVLVET